ncbi:MAG: hypothetical protein M1481_07505 [Candidatus Thermoplasmatota archaeon]|jgi:hypothetical protein|nr:hypothetical protein [Candidatus Thermoplasmatota archaeon]MCL5963693.1 hypothetical protein [Candidatus Thermoplasmatota archaeon]
MNKNILYCKNCPMWYGDIDEKLGPCSIKHMRGKVNYITYSRHQCDEGFNSEV